MRTAPDPAPEPPGSTGAAPAAEGARLPWPAVPEPLRRRVEDHLGGRVVEAVTQPGGFSPGAAARLRLADGSRAFVKAAGPRPNPESPKLHRAEARIAAALPASVPAPRLLGSFEHAGWVVLMFDDVDGRAPAQPWRRGELNRVLAALTGLAEALTPAPVQAPAAGERFGDQFRGWRHLAAASPHGRELAALDPWARRHLRNLAELEASWERAAAGGSLVHADLRADNLLLTAERVFVVDWPWACTAQPWFDLLAMLPSVHMQGGPPPAAVFGGHPVAAGADPAAVTAVLAALAGFFVYRAGQPAPPGLPTLREFQRAQGRTALSWLRHRTGWP